MERKQIWWMYRWREEALTIMILMSFAFFINRHVQLTGLCKDDLYLWSCVREQPFLNFVFPMHSPRFRVLYNLASYIEFCMIGSHVTWFLLFNIALNGLIAYTVCLMARELSTNRLIGTCIGLIYLMSRFSYYQITQAIGILESLALWTAIIILFLLYRYLNEYRQDKLSYFLACGLYLIICFIHERYMALLPLFFVVLLMRKEKKPGFWITPIALFAVVQLIRVAVLGTVLPAGTGGTEVANTFEFGTAVQYAISQVLYLFGINTGPEHLSMISWQHTARWAKLAVAAVDLLILTFVVLFIVKVIRDRKNRPAYLKTALLFILFIGACITASSVTIRVELRWLYVSMTAAWLFLSYMCGAICGIGDTPKKPASGGKTAGKGARRLGMVPIRLPNYRNGAVCILLVGACTVLMYVQENYYRTYYPNLYYWNEQKAYNSLADETWGKYGPAIFGKKIYIIDTEHFLTDFYARTFFKIFDKEGKAEGTEVVMVDSIRDFGQVTENMMVLRGDPSAHVYQDITNMVRELKCEPVYGYHSDGWMERDAKIRVMAGSTGVIDLKIYYPGEMDGTEVSAITVDGQPAMTVAIDRSIKEVQLETEPYRTVELEFNNNFNLKGDFNNEGDQERSIIVNITAD